MTAFTTPDQFMGMWHGSWDGRPAELEIGGYKDDSPVWHCHITLSDGTAKFRADNVRHSANENILRDIVLKGIHGTTGEKVVKLLLLHNWNARWMSGHSLWKGAEAGFAFKRESTD